ncbi:MAG: CBS domain-containing protein [Gammaproteobacteria bacterium]|nr:CBS domain-containing protein [Gammaproteobacteria bacterium]
MSGAHLEFLAKHLRIGFYPKGTIVTQPVSGVARTLYIVKQGRVRGELEGGRRPTAGEVWELVPGECFPIGALLAHRAVAIKQRAVEDTFCFELDRDDFETLLLQSPVFSDFCARRLANLLDETLRGMQAGLVGELSRDVSLNTPLVNLIRRLPVTCTPDTSLALVAARLHGERVSAIVVTDSAGAPLGLFTTNDLLGVVAQGTALDRSIASVMSARLLMLPPRSVAHEAAMLMARHSVSHVCVVEHDRVVGVVAERDLFSMQRIGLVSLTRAIIQAPDLATLARLGRDVHRLIDQMLAQGAALGQFTQIIASLNDHIARRVITLCVAEEGTAPVPFTWIAFGSEGRQEQTLKTDQDNGILFDVPAGGDAEQVRAELLPLARSINEALDTCGYPLCWDNVMASNAACCLSGDEWRERFRLWIEHGTVEQLQAAGTYFDFRVVYGDELQASTLRRWLMQQTSAAPQFLQRLGESALRHQAPIGLERGAFAESVGEYATTLDLKRQGTALFVDGARLLALANDIAQTNTIERLRAAAQLGVVDASEVDAWCDAYSFLQLLRLRHQQALLREGRPINNHVDADGLSDLDRRILKESFRQARKLQRRIAGDFQLPSELLESE